MPWNQPGSGGDNGQDPWGNKRGEQGPPDLDEVIRNLKKKFGGLFGRRSGGGGNGSGQSGGKGLPSLPGKSSLMVVVVIIVGGWLASGFYTVEQGENGVVLQLGKFKETTQAGLHWRFPTPIETVEVINVQKVNTVEVGYRANNRTRQATSVLREALMLTKDENIIDIHFAVQFDVKDPTRLLFNVSEPVSTVVRSATESAVRQIVGRNTMDFAITAGRAEIAQETKVLLQQILDRYETGLNIRAVEMQNAQPPSQVKDAFDDAVRAREDEERIKNEAEAYANDIIPRARGKGARITQEAEAYKASVVARAKGEASRFEQVLAEYQKAPEVTRDRLYLEAMEEVLANSSKLMIDQKGGNNVIYLPLDQLMRQRAGQGAESGFTQSLSTSSSGSSDSTTDSSRSRGSRSALRERGDN